ncbi:MAG: alpha/beta fold hydrolase, partial [Myxococcota bacterium]
MNRIVIIAAALAIAASCTPHKRRAKKAAPPKVGIIKPDVKVPSKQYTAEAFFKTTSFGIARDSDYAWSLDNSSLLVHHDQTGVFNVYAMSVKNGSMTPLTSSTKGAAFATSYFPNDDRILFSMDGEGDEQTHVFVRELDGTIEDLTPGEKVKSQFAGWHDNGKTFWVTSNERTKKYFDVYAYAADGYARELIFENKDFLVAGASGDGRWLALVKTETSANSDIYVVDLKSQERNPVLITKHEGDIAYDVYGFTPDNQQLIYATNEYGEFTQAWTYALEGGAKTELLTADWDVQAVTYSKSGRFFASAVNEDAQTQISIIDTTTGKPVELGELPDGNLARPRFSRDEKQLAFGLTSDTSPLDLYVSRLGAGAVTRLTSALNPEIDEKDLVTSSIVRYPSYDGLKIPSVLYKPHQASVSTKVPALVLVHGGPGGQTRRGYRALVQHLVNHGYAVLGANNRGSNGYGKTYYHMDDRKHGDVDLKDIVWGHKWLSEQDWVNPDQIGIIGGSYGGYMVAAALAFEPEVFQVGIDIFGVTNWERTLQSIPPWWEAFKKALYDEMGDPETDAERHR